MADPIGPKTPVAALPDDKLIVMRGDAVAGDTLEKIEPEAAETGAIIAGSLDAAIGEGWRQAATVTSDPTFAGGSQKQPPSEAAVGEAMGNTLAAAQTIEQMLQSLNQTVLVVES